MLLEPELRWIALLPVSLAVVGLGLVTAACDKRQAGDPQAEVGAAQPEAAAPPQAMGKVDISHRGDAAPAIPFLRPDGGPATLAGFRGKPLLVNLWATWCAPCIREMPALDKLAQGRAGDFRLMVVSQDLAGKREVDPFFAKNRFVALKPYLDKQNVLMEALKTDTLPTTVFYDAKGREQWRVTGSMDWSGERAKTLIDDALKGPA